MNLIIMMIIVTRTMMMITNTQTLKEGLQF